MPVRGIMCPRASVQSGLIQGLPPPARVYFTYWVPTVCRHQARLWDTKSRKRALTLQQFAVRGGGWRLDVQTIHPSAAPGLWLLDRDDTEEGWDQVAWTAPEG